MESVDAGAMAAAETGRGDRHRSGVDGGCAGPELVSPISPEALFLARTRADERLRLGQIFTPPALVRMMVDWIAPSAPGSVLDPAVGPGALLAGWREADMGAAARLTGYDVDARALALAAARLPGADLVEADMLSATLAGVVARHDAVLANPPFVRAHWCTPEVRERLARVSAVAGVPLGARANLALGIALAGLMALKPGGRASLLLPASVLTSDAARDFREALAGGWLRGVVRLGQGARPFPGHSVGACLLRIERPVTRRARGRGLRPEATSASSFESRSGDGAPASPRAAPVGGDGLVPLSALATVRRGVATGANGFFHLTDAAVRRWSLAADVVVPCIGRAADAPSARMTIEDYARLRAAGRPVWLFAPGRGGPLDRASDAYLIHGLRLGIAERSLPARRKPWYRPERIAPAPIWLTTFGRLDGRGAPPGRVVRNAADLLHLTAFHGLYPVCADTGFADALASALCASSVRRQLDAMVRDQGGGLGKLEPGDIARLRVADIRRTTFARLGAMMGSGDTTR